MASINAAGEDEDGRTAWWQRLKYAVRLIGRENLTPYAYRYSVSEAEMVENLPLEDRRARAGHSSTSRMFLRYANNNTYNASYTQVIVARRALAESMRDLAAMTDVSAPQGQLLRRAAEWLVCCRHTKSCLAPSLQIPITDPRRVQEAADKMDYGCDPEFMNKLSPDARQDLQAAIELTEGCVISHKLCCVNINCCACGAHAAI